MPPSTKPILIAGPTASGKSALAMALAERLSGVVINADSMQVYSDLRVLTARPTVEDEAAVPHALYGYVSGDAPYSTGTYARAAAIAVADAQASGKVPVIVGGTGLYFRALLQGLSPIPQIPNEVRSKWRALAAEQGAYALWQMLSKSDPVMAFRLDPNDTQRITRAHEVLDATGRSLASWQDEPGEPVLDEAQCIRLLVQVERETLRARCDARFDQMMGNGAVEEVADLAALKRPPDSPVMRALGVRPLLQLIEGVLPKEAAVEQAKAETRQYVKRQETWFRSNMISWKYISQQQMKTINDTFVAFIYS